MDDASIIKLYFDRNEQAIKETETKYGKLCFSLANNMLDNQQDSQECVNDAFFAVWNIIPPQKPKNFTAFLCKITKNLALKKAEYNNAQKRGRNMTSAFEELKDCVSDMRTPDEVFNAKELSCYINRFLQNQKEKERIVFIKRYWFFDSVSDISKSMELSEDKVYLILFRTRQKLKKFLIKEGFDL